MSCLACNANLQLDKSIKSQSFPPQPHREPRLKANTIWIYLHREFNDPHYSAIVGKHYEASNLNYQRLNNLPLNGTPSSKVPSQWLTYLSLKGEPPSLNSLQFPLKKIPCKNHKYCTKLYGANCSLTAVCGKLLCIYRYLYNSHCCNV